MNRSHLFVVLSLAFVVAMLLPVAAGVNTHSVNSQQLPSSGRIGFRVAESYF